MDSEVTDLAGVKAVTIATLQVKPSEGPFVDGDKTKLDAIEAGAQVNVSGDTGNAAVYDNSGTPTLKSGITKTEIQTLINVEDGAKDDQTAEEVVSTATTNIAALTVQTALAELDTEKLALAGGSMTGDINMGTNDISNIGNATISGNLDVTGDTSISTLDSSGATSLATSSGAVNIASSGAITTVKGTLNVDEAVTLDSTLDVTGVTNLNNTTQSSSSNTGALVIDGGVGIAKNLNVGGTVDVTGATSMAAISSDGVVTLSDNTTSSSSTTGALKVTGGVGITENLNVGGTFNVTGAATAPTPPASSNSTLIATTAFVAAGTAGTVTSISDHIQFSSSDSDAATSGSEYSATASIAKGRRTFDKSNKTNTFYAGIDLDVNSIVTISITQVANYGGANIQPAVTNINTTDNTFEITTYSNGVDVNSTVDFTFNFIIIK